MLDFFIFHRYLGIKKRLFSINKIPILLYIGFVFQIILKLYTFEVFNATFGKSFYY